MTFKLPVIFGNCIVINFSRQIDVKIFYYRFLEMKNLMREIWHAIIHMRGNSIIITRKGSM